MDTSSDSLFHYTDRFENLSKIIEEGFRVNYNLETTYIDWYLKNEKKDNIAHYIPMISLSDISLASAKQHIERYNASYGIGIKKSWAIENYFNPVFYFEVNSKVADLLLDMRSEIRKGDFSETYDMLNYIDSFTKQPKGVIRKKSVDHDYWPYKEREWRYIPELKLLKVLKIFSVDLYFPMDKTEELDDYNEKVRKIKQAFFFQDINYIIVRDEKERDIMISLLKKKKDSSKEIQSNLSKSGIRTFSEIDDHFVEIYTINELKEDF